MSAASSREGNLRIVEPIAALLQLELEELTRVEILALLPATGCQDETFSPRFLTRLLRRGLRVRVLQAVQPGEEEDLSAPRLRGDEVATTPIEFPHPVIIRDRAFVYQPSPGLNHGIRPLVRVKSAVMAESLSAIFDVIWAISTITPVGAFPAGGNIEERAVLRMLNRGVTDERAAANLHMSKRTFARRVAGAVHLLGANSRFQAGAEAARRGLL